MRCKTVYKTYYGFHTNKAEKKNRFETTRQKRAHFEVSIYMYSMSTEYKKVNFFFGTRNKSFDFVYWENERITYNQKLSSLLRMDITICLAKLKYRIKRCMFY